MARAVEGMGVEVARIRGRGSRRGKLQRSKLSDGLLRPWRGGAAPDVLALVLRGHPHSPPWRGRVLRLRGAFEWFQRVADEVVPERRILAPCAEGDDVQASEHEPGRRFGGVEALTDVVAAVGRLPKKRLVFFSPLRRLVRSSGTAPGPQRPRAAPRAPRRQGQVSLRARAAIATQRAATRVASGTLARSRSYRSSRR